MQKPVRSLPDYMSWVAPVGRTASRTPHCRSTALETSTSASRRRSLTGSTDSGSWPARPSAVQSNSQRLFRRRASHRPAAEQVRLPGYLYETGAPREKGLRSYHERYHKRDDAKLAILAKESPAVSIIYTPLPNSKASCSLGLPSISRGAFTPPQKRLPARRLSGKQSIQPVRPASARLGVSASSSCAVLSI